jgi:hypothetical protein
MNEPTRKPADELDTLPEQAIEGQEEIEVKGGFDPQPDPPKLAALQLPLTRPDPAPVFKKPGL